MSFYIGILALVLGAFYFWRSARHRTLVISARERAEANGGLPEIDSFWTSMGLSFMPFFLFYGAFTSLLLIGGYFLTDLKQYLSLFDLFGLLTLIVAYTGWILIRTLYNKLGLDLSGS
ncbi:hypothetical protein [Halochromatium salexigens]|uniref:Uncharacterized protein n=1 Tax=Halochromatium salexigens TaxID=49447 RepID=A0AAJ0UDX3_HALSE|nr:hypothetical protein [Halochromatium salexigens]MBK5929658.1 hypothetical protein [Halochromatium salexigens]